MEIGLTVEEIERVRFQMTHFATYDRLLLVALAWIEGQLVNTFKCNIFLSIVFQ